MNMRSFVVVSGSVVAACFAAANYTACVFIGSGGAGGDTGSGGHGGAVQTSASSNSSSSSSKGAGGTGGSTGSSMDGGMCDPNYKCAEAIAPGSDPTKLCAGSNSAMLYDTYYMCSCQGKCMSQCAANYCKGMVMDPLCDICTQDTSPTGCGIEKQACSGDS
jgi:hypothetical protein